MGYIFAKTLQPEVIMAAAAASAVPGSSSAPAALPVLSDSVHRVEQAAGGRASPRNRAEEGGDLSQTYPLVASVLHGIQCVYDVVLKGLAKEAPHIVLSMMLTYPVVDLSNYFLVGIVPSLDRDSAVTFVGVASLAYKIATPILFQMFRRENELNKGCRRVLDLTHTFIPTIAIHQIWHLNIPPQYGIAAWAITFGGLYHPWKWFQGYRPPNK